VSDEPKVITDLRFLHEGKVEWLSTECATTGVNISEILAAYDTIRASLAAAERDAARYDYLRALLRHAKWNDIDTLHELKPEHEKFIADASLDSAIDAQITYSRAALATPTTTEDA